MKDKAGNKITVKEFFQRWKEGISNITPLQKLQNEYRGTIIILIGFIMSSGALIIYRDKLIVSWFAYGLVLIFVGNIWTNGVKCLVLRTQIKGFTDLDKNAVNLDDVFNALDAYPQKELKGESKTITVIDEGTEEIKTDKYEGKEIQTKEIESEMKGDNNG